MDTSVINGNVEFDGLMWFGSVVKQRGDGISEVLWEGMGEDKNSVEDRAIRAYVAHKNDFAGKNSPRDW